MSKQRSPSTLIWITAAFVACSDERRATPAVTEQGSGSGSAAQPAAPPPIVMRPWAFREAFAVPFAVTFDALRAQSRSDGCEHGVSLDRDAQGVALLSSMAFASEGAPCDPQGSLVEMIMRALDELAAIGPAPVGFSALVMNHRPTLERYLAIVATLPADATADAIRQKCVDEQLLAPWHRLADRLGFRVTGVELHGLEPRPDAGGHEEKALRAMVGKGPWPPRIPTHATLRLERTGSPPARGQRAATPRTFAAMYALPASVELTTVKVRIEHASCPVVFGISHGGPSLKAAARCTPEPAKVAEAATLFHALQELRGKPPHPRGERLVIGASFGEHAVLEKWIPVIRSPAWRNRKRGTSDHHAIAALAISERVFAYLDPFAQALGLKVSVVSTEKMWMRPGKEILAEDPSLAGTGLTATDKIPIPAMSAVILAP